MPDGKRHNLTLMITFALGDPVVPKILHHDMTDSRLSSNPIESL
jgi:hypothetical protein